MIERAAAWLISKQNADGGWGESCHSYVDESFAGVGASTPSQTAWAVNALQIAGLGDDAPAQRGLAYIKETQTPMEPGKSRISREPGFPATST